MISSHNINQDQFKRSIDESLFDRLSPKISLDLKCSGLTIRFHIYDMALLDGLGETRRLLFKEIQSSASKTAQIEVHWHASTKMPQPWIESEDANCHFSEHKKNQLTLQRDFACSRQSDHSYTLVTSPVVLDGLHNFLRFLIPRELLKLNQFIFHSACVLNDSGAATLFLGHSGYGKSTLAAKFPRNKVLGDDMNIVVFRANQLFVEPIHLGQIFTNWQLQGELFPIKNVFWLSKAPTDAPVSIGPLPAPQQRIKIISSLSGFFWDQLGSSEIDSVFEFSEQFLSIQKIKSFSFSLNSEVTQYV